MGRPKEHGPETRAALLAAAAELVHAEGPAAVSVRRVAEAVGTTTRAVYSLFGDKEGLLHALSVDVAETMRRHHESVPELTDPLDELPLLIAGYRAAALEKPQLYELFFGMVRAGADWDDPLFALVFSSFSRVLSTLRRAIDEERFPGHNLFTAGRYLLAMVHGLATLELRGVLGDPRSADHVWATSVETAIAGLTQGSRAA